MAYPTDTNATEVQIIDAIIASALREGLVISVYDGEEWTVKCSADREAITAAIGTTDETRLALRRPVDGKFEIIGGVFLVHGNDGYDVIADHTDTPAMAAILADANMIADVHEERANRITLTPGWGFGGQTV
ncbi:MAG: hypothetical protein Q8K33_01610 [Cypionkella sp.]|uniref:hypothetical protein n=1 Tax=Cypionkella sp. TaxID=2811411 RepID=UPI00272F0C3E|nr:hypothetical protein [Cypionkella sp.]MDP2047578.1 hypothetical protein [Cypionkella sp.]